MIKSIELINWKTHKHTVIDFQKGVNVLIGVMGAGKSSVMDGISFGLFGTFPALNHKRTTTENLISNRPNVEENAEVRLKFTVGDDEYTVARKIRKGESASAKLDKNDSYLQAQPARVTEEVQNLIKLDYDTFSRAIYAEQNRIDYFLELTKSDRKRQIDQMLGLDNFARAEENTTSLINGIKSMIADEEGMLAQSDVKELKKQLEKLTEERRAVEKEQLQLAEQGKERESQLKIHNTNLAEMKSKSERSRKLQKELAELSSRIETLGKELKKIAELGIDKKSIESEFDSKSKKLEALDAEIKRLRKRESEIMSEIADAQAAIKHNNKKSAEKAKILEAIKGKNPERMEKELSEKEAAMQDSLKELSSFKGRKEELRKWAKELGEHISKCPVCERELSEEMKKALLTQKNAALKELEALMAKQEEKIKSMEEETAALRKETEGVRLSIGRMDDYKEVDELLSKSSAIEKEAKARHNELKGEVESRTDSRESLSKELGQISIKREAISRKEKYESEIKDSSTQLAKRKEELDMVNFDEKKLYSLQELITKESAAFADINGKVVANERYLKSIEAQIEDRAKNIANTNAISERIENRRGQLSNMNKFKIALVETEAHLRNSLVSSINTLMADIWSDLYPYGDYTGIRLNAKKDDYLLEASTGMDVEGRKSWIDIDGVASGGERSVACLTMRIALAMVIVPNLKWLILDEPTHNIDENGINRFIEVLGNSLPKFVEQVFIITHDNALKNISSARVYQFERNKDMNEYTSVTEL